jgi:hypothetical protein
MADMYRGVRGRNCMDPADPDRVAGTCNGPEVAGLVDIFHRHGEIRLTPRQRIEDSSVALRSHP